MADLATAIVLVPYLDRIVPQVDEALRSLERAGIRVWRQPFCSDIAFCRSWMVSDAMHAGNQSMLFVDSDVEFRVPDAIRLLERDEPIVAGAYSQKVRTPDGVLKLNCRFAPGESVVTFGAGGGDVECLGVGCGFLRLTAYGLGKMVGALSIPLCTAGGRNIYPFFLPSVIDDGEGWVYQGEDYSFCWRAREAGIPIICDTTIFLKHHGDYGFSWDDLGMTGTPHHDSRTLLLKPES